MLMQSKEGQKMLNIFLIFRSLEVKHFKVFSDIPPGRPPEKGIKHIIELDEGPIPS